MKHAVQRIPFHKIRRLKQWILPLLITGLLIQCINPQITGEGIAFWRDINSLTEIHTGRFAWGHDRLLTERLDTLYTAQQSFTLMAREIKPTRWIARDGGCLRIPAGVQVTLGYFQFQGAAPTDTLIIVDGGSLELIGCDVLGPAGGGIIVRNGGNLVLSQSRIQDITQPLVSSNSTLTIEHVRVKNARRPGVEIVGGAGHRLTGLDIRNIDGAGLVITHAQDATLNHIQVSAVSADGIHTAHVGYFQLDSTQIQQAVGRGLFLSDIQSLSISDVKISGSGLAGVALERVKQSKLARLMSTKNGNDGLSASLFDTMDIAQTILYKNGRSGGAFEAGLRLRISGGVSSENQHSGLWIHDVDSGQLDSVQVKLNQVSDSTAGVFISQMEAITIRNSEFHFNVGSGLVLAPMPKANLTNNFFYRNVITGATIRSVGELVLEENRFIRNATGLNLKSVDKLDHRNNVYEENLRGLVATETNLNSEKNKYTRHEVTGMALLDSRFVGRDETLVGNQTGLIGVGGSIELQDGHFVDNGVGMNVSSSQVNIQQGRFDRGETGLKLAGITTGIIQNSQFTEQTVGGMEVNGAANIILTNNSISDTPVGFAIKAVDFANISRNEISHCTHAGFVWDRVDNGIIRYNLLVENDAAIRVRGDSRLPEIENNTLVANANCFLGVTARDLVVRYNIFLGNRLITQEPIGPVPGSRGTWAFNCLWENEGVPTAALDKKAGNFIADPVFQQAYYLKSASPCLEVGPDRRLAGARGLTPAIKPKSE